MTSNWDNFVAMNREWKPGNAIEYISPEIPQFEVTGYKGERYEAMAPVPDEVLLAAGPFVDVMSFQHFGPVEKIRAGLARFAELTDKPVLLADSAGSLKQPDGTIRNDPAKYRETLAALREIPACVGFHLCGAYLRNHARNRGLRDEQERPDTETVAAITQANRETAEWAKRAAAH